MVKREIKEKFPFSGIEKYVEGVFRKHVFDLPLLHDANIYPQVHATMNDWELTSTENAMPYLPSQQDPVKLTLGIHDLTNISLPTFSSTNINKYMRYKRGHIFNTGSNVCSLDFAPKTTLIDSNPLIHFLATGGYKERNELHSFETQQQGYQNCIQLWNCDLNTTRSEDQVSAPHLDLCLLHDFGHVRALKWCPYGAYEENLDSDMDDNSSIPKLGILAACFGDGTVRILVIPHPDILRSRLDINHQEPIYLKIKHSRCIFSLPNTSLSTLAWGGHKKLAIGTSSGNISLWNMESALQDHHRDDAGDKRRSLRFMIFNVMAHDAGVQSIVFHGLRDPVNLVSVGNDAKLNILDIQDPFVPMTIFRLRSIIYCVVWPGHCQKISFVDGDLMGKEANMQDCQDFKSGQHFAECSGMMMCMAASEQHVYITHGTSDGFVKFHNSYTQRIRGVPKIQPVVYKLIYHEETDTYRYIDGLEPIAIKKKGNNTDMVNFVLDHNISINQVCWNHNSKTSAWMASAGSNGLCRLDFIGVGEDWD